MTVDASGGATLTCRATARGPYEQVSRSTASVIVTNTCGDGEVHAGEECDDGNLDDADICRQDCTRHDAPTIDTIRIRTNSGTHMGDEIICEAIASDANNDEITLTYGWYVTR